MGTPPQPSPLIWVGCPGPHPWPWAPITTHIVSIYDILSSLSSNTQPSHTEERLSLHSIWTRSAWHWTTNYLVIKLNTSYAPPPWNQPRSCLVHKLKQPSLILELKKGCSASFQGAKVLHVCRVGQSSFQIKGLILVFSLNEYWESSHQFPTHMSWFYYTSEVFFQNKNNKEKTKKHLFPT